jgi:hypothetical protein
MGEAVTDPLDQPENETHSLVFPFIACRSHGGPYDDESFVAGAALGRIDKALEDAAAETHSLRFTVPTALVRQLELCAMARGFPAVVAEQVEGTDEYPAMPEWSFVTFARARDQAFGRDE